MYRECSLQVVAVATALALVLPGPLQTVNAAEFIINNLDAPGEGFNDNGSPDYASAQGGNTGTTLGEQRLQAMQRAADVWGAALESAVPITVDASMDPLQCSPHTGILGYAGPISALFHTASETWQVVAKINADEGYDWYPDNSDIEAQFNSGLGGPTCLPGTQWYYGLDRQAPAGTADFYATVVHELVHGLGFIDSVNRTTGAFNTGEPYLFDTFLAERGVLNKSLTKMTDGERLSAIASRNELVWTGATVTETAASVLSFGRHASTGEVLMYAPFGIDADSAASHFHPSLLPDEIMEPYGTDTVDDRLTKALLQDIGWTVTTSEVGVLENPGVHSYKSGVGIISGWVCSATSVVVIVDGTPVQTAYGTERTDTQSVCGDSDNGFGALYNWNRFGDGAHTAIAYADGVEFGRANFTVTTLSGEFLTGANTAAWFEFPATGNKTYIKWQESSQNFVMYNPSVTADGGFNSAFGRLENPSPGAAKSGIGVISGWICSAGSVVVTVDGTAFQTSYGTERPDTAGVCGDTDNGFAALYNWNRFGDGAHTAIAYADGVEFARSNFTVTTLGDEFLTGLNGTFLVPEFPFAGRTTTVYWVESEQNFAIRKVE